jgi:hypothetical protein
MKTSIDTLIGNVAKTLDRGLVEIAIGSYVEMHGRYLAGQWRPSEVDGGRFCEAIHRCIYQLDTGTVTFSKSLGEIRAYLRNDTVAHKLQTKDRKHITSVLEFVYEFRSDRDVVHISNVHTANQMDSMLVVHACKWILGELLRLAWTQDGRVIGEVISQIVQFEHSIIHELDGRPMVMATDLTTPEEILLLLNHAEGQRLTVAELRSQAPNLKPNAISVALSRLRDAREVRDTDDRKIALTSLGQKRVMEKIVPKLNSPL